MSAIKAYIPERSVKDNLGGKVRAIYDFDVHGGAVGTIDLDLKLPKGAIVSKGYLHVLTAVTTSASGTLSVGLNNTVDLLAATAAGSLTANAILPLEPSFTAAISSNHADGVSNSTPLLLTAERSLKVEIATGALTAGKVAIVLEYEGSFEDVKPVTYHAV